MVAANSPSDSALYPQPPQGTPGGQHKGGSSQHVDPGTPVISSQIMVVQKGRQDTWPSPSSTHTCPGGQHRSAPGTKHSLKLAAHTHCGRPCCIAQTFPGPQVTPAHLPGRSGGPASWAKAAPPGIEASTPPRRVPPINRSAWPLGTVPLANPLASSSKECRGCILFFFSLPRCISVTRLPPYRKRSPWLCAPALRRVCLCRVAAPKRCASR